jgi:plasmid rolling circle replication initiator protein Rep
MSINKRISQTDSKVKLSPLSPWREKKKEAIKIAKKLQLVGHFERSKRVMECSELLIKRKCECGHTHIQTANLCRDRMCPVCNWRLSLKRYANMIHILDFMRNNIDTKYHFLFMTLTIKNCKAPRLNATVKHMSQSWNRLLQRKAFKEKIEGFARSVEVTLNRDREDFHPHFHIIAAVRVGECISPEEVREAWREVLRISYDPITDIREVYNKNKREAGDDPTDDATAAVLETFKYAVKSKTLQDMPLNLFRELSDQINSLRMVSFGGVFKKVKNTLALEMESISESDEISIRKDECSKCGHLMQEVLYKWSFGEDAYQEFKLEE